MFKCGFEKARFVPGMLKCGFEKARFVLGTRKCGVLHAKIVRGKWQNAPGKIGRKSAGDPGWGPKIQVRVKKYKLAPKHTS